VTEVADNKGFISKDNTQRPLGDGLYPKGFCVSPGGREGKSQFQALRFTRESQTPRKGRAESHGSALDFEFESERLDRR